MVGDYPNHQNMQFLQVFILLKLSVRVAWFRLAGLWKFANQLLCYHVHPDLSMTGGLTDN